MYIYGKNPINDLWNKNPSLIIEIYIERKRHQSFYDLLLKNGVIVKDINKFNFKNIEINKKINHQGIIAKIKNPKIFELNELLIKNKDKKNQLYIILDQIEDPQNFGAILRICAAFNVDGVIYPTRKSAKLNSTSMKTSSGNWIDVNLCEVSSLNKAIGTLKNRGIWIASTTLSGEDNFSTLINLNQSMAIIFGNEGKGVRPSLQQKSEINIKLNMSNKVESLNVSATAAIILHRLYNNEI